MLAPEFGDTWSAPWFARFSELRRNELNTRVRPVTRPSSPDRVIPSVQNVLCNKSWLVQIYLQLKTNEKDIVHYFKYYNDTGWPRSYRKYIRQITQPSQYRYAQLQYRFAVISGSPSRWFIWIFHVDLYTVYTYNIFYCMLVSIWIWIMISICMQNLCKALNLWTHSR